MIFESFGGDGSDAAVAVAAFAMSLTVSSQSSLLLSSTTAAANLPESVVVDKIYKNEKKQKEEKGTLRRERESWESRQCWGKCCSKLAGRFCRFCCDTSRTKGPINWPVSRKNVVCR